MKKTLFLLLLMLATAFSSVHASIIDLGIEDDSNGLPKDGPRTVLPSVQVSAFNDELVLDISRYNGYALVTIVSEVDNSVMSNTYYVNGYNNICLDFTGYAVGRYEFTVSLGNGLAYAGSFRIE